MQNRGLGIRYYEKTVEEIKGEIDLNSNMQSA